MNKKYFLLSVIALLLISNFAMLYFVVQKGKGHFHPGGPKNIIVEKLQLDEQQIIAYQNLINHHRNDILQKDEQFRALKKELYEGLKISDSRVKLDSLTNEMGLVQQQIEAIHYRHFLDIKALCKPEQLPKFEQLSSELIEIFNPKKHPKPKQK